MSAILINPGTRKQDLLSYSSFSGSGNRISRSGRAVRVLLIGAFSLIGLISMSGGLSAQAQTAAATSPATQSTVATVAATVVATTVATKSASPVTPRASASATRTATGIATGTATVTATATASPTRANPNAVPLSIWYSWQGDEAPLLQSAIDAYQAAHQNLAISSQSVDLNDLTVSQFINQLTAAQRAGQPPTILLIPATWIADLGDASLIAPIPASDLSRWKTSVVESAWNAVTYKKRVYGIPQSLQCVGLFSNPALTGSQTLTADDLLKMPNVAVPFTFYDTAGIYFGSGGSLSQLADLTSGRSTQTSPALIRYFAALHDWNALIDAATPIPYPTTIGLIPPTAPTPVLRLPSDFAFRNGQLSYAISDNAALNDYRLYLPNVTVQSLPNFASGAPWQSLVETESYLITASDPKLHATALDLIASLTDSNVQVQIGNLGNFLPVSAQAASQLTDSGLQALATQCQTGAFPSPDMAKVLQSPLLDDSILAVISGAQSPQQAADRITKQLVPVVVVRTLTPTVTPSVTLPP